MAERGVLSLLADGHALASPGVRRSGVWVMGRSWYDRARGVLCSEDEERVRAEAHRRVRVAVLDDVSGVVACPACGLAVGDYAGVLRHVADLMDPAFREPSPQDRFLGRPVRVVEGDVPPRLVVSWVCPVCGVERVSVPCADCGVCDGCCPSHVAGSAKAAAKTRRRWRPAR